MAREVNVRFVQIAVDPRDGHVYALDDEGRVWVRRWPQPEHEEWKLLSSPMEPS
jgi:hypothetical protein